MTNDNDNYNTPEDFARHLGLEAETDDCRDEQVKRRKSQKKKKS
jgi:hypothetical protein